MKRTENSLDEQIKTPLLLVIDMQNVYSQGQIWECRNFNNICQNIKKLLNNPTDEQIIFTRYIASENPIGIWKDYNRENIDVNINVWLNEIADELKEAVKNHECYDKSVYSSFSINEIRQATQEKTCVVVAGVGVEDKLACIQEFKDKVAIHANIKSRYSGSGNVLMSVIKNTIQ